MAKPTGIRKRPNGSYEAFVYDPRSKTKIRKSFPTMAAARDWRTDALAAKKHGALVTPTRRTVREAGDALLADAEAGIVRRRGGQEYKPSALRSYKGDLEKFIYPDIGAIRLADVRRRDVQALADRMTAAGASGSKVRNVVNALRVVYRRALENDELTSNPTMHLRLPDVGEPRHWEETPSYVRELLDALPLELRAIYAAAAYAGLRRGELRALRVEHVNADEPGIQVVAGWDDYDGFILPKSKAGTRWTLLPATLWEILGAWIEQSGRSDSGLVFGRTATEPFTATHVRKRAHATWTKAGLEPVGLHSLRHAFASFLDGAEVSDARARRYLGHAGASVSDRYRHRLRGQLASDAELLDVYLTGNTGASTGAETPETAWLSENP